MNIHIVISVFMSFLSLTACKKSTEGHAGPDENQNLILNPSFEQNGTASLEGWEIETNMDSTIRFSEDVPQSGGRWSIVLSVGDRVLTRLRTTVVAPSGTNYYILSIWGKSNGATGVIRVVFDKIILRSLTISDTTWILYQTFDTLSTANGDSISVELDGGVTSSYSETYFDLCSLEKVN